MHTNHGAAISSGDGCASVTVSDNRIEWNRNGGINLVNANSVNVTGNFFDRSYGPAIKIAGQNTQSNAVTITGNIFRRSGRCMTAYENKYLNSHIYLESCSAITATTNSFTVGADDKPGGITSPDFGIVLKNSINCVISGNVMQNGAIKENIAVLDKNENVIIKDNPGSLYSQ